MKNGWCNTVFENTNLAVMEGIMEKIEIEKERESLLELKEQLTVQESIRNQINEKINELDNLIREKEKKLQIFDYYSAVRNFLISAKNFERHYLNRNTTTRDMMTRLKRGYYTKENYTYKKGKCILLGETEHYVDYYIINHRYILLYSGRLNISFKPPIYTSFTATEFEQNGHIYNPPLKNKSSDMIIILNNQKIRLYDNPIQLCGQTYDDMDYRKEWYNGELEYEGNNYGDTSDFYFVGEIE